jgi:Mn2+/Fe2+ NRAMP family transporter
MAAMADNPYDPPQSDRPPSPEPASAATQSPVTIYDPYAMPEGALAEPPKSLWMALRKIGPGIILAGSIIGSGELLLTTSLGAEYGFLFLGLILYSCVIKVFVQIELGRYAISSGKPTLGVLNELPGPRFGAHWLVWWWLIMMLLTISQLGAMAGAVGQAMDMAFPSVSPALASFCSGLLPAIGEKIQARPDFPWATVTAITAVLLLLSGGYRRIERVTTFMIAAVTASTILCVAILPSTGYPLRISDFSDGFSLDIFSLPAAAIGAAFAAFGITGVGASELYAYPYWCLEKGYARFAGRNEPTDDWLRRARGWIRVMHLDAWVSMIVFTVATVCFYCLGATVLHQQNLHPKGTDMIATLSEMYVPIFGDWTKVLFLIGVWAVLFKTLYVSAASHSRLTADFLNLANFVHYPNAEARARWIRRFCVLFPMGALLLYFAFGEPRGMVIFGGFFQGVTLPVIAAVSVFLRYRRTDPRLAPSRLSDLCLWLAFISISIVAIYATWGKLRDEIVPGIASFLGFG